MKPKHFLLICISFFIASIFSCQKDFTAPDNITLRPDSAMVVGGDSNYLDKILVVDSGNSPGFENSIWVFNYDNLKRLKNVAIKSVNNPADSSIFLKFLYNSNDTLPYKIMEYDSSTLITDYFCYYNNGKLVKDSMFDYTSPAATPYFKVSNYSYNLANSIINNGWQISYFGSMPATLNERDTFLLDSRANVISAKFYKASSGSPNYILFGTSSYAYDNMKSPYLKVSPFNIYLFISTNSFSSNNLTTQNSTSFIGVNNNSSVFTNTYYSNGFLKKKEVSNTFIPNSTYTFSYKSL